MTSPIGFSETRGTVALMFPPPPMLGMAENLTMAVEMSPAEAREIALSIQRMADAAEGVPSRH